MVRWALRISNSTDFKLTTNILLDFTNQILSTFHQTHFPLRDTVHMSVFSGKIHGSTNFFYTKKILKKEWKLLYCFVLYTKKMVISPIEKKHETRCGK